MHGERRARRRLPADFGDKDITRRNILISLTVALGRLIIAVVVGEELGLAIFVLLLMLLVFSIAVVYEILRSRPSSSTPTRSSSTVVAIWCIVGLGYGVRAGLGIIVGGFPISNILTWIGVLCFIAFGIMFVLLTWVLEAASFYYRKESDRTWWAKEKAVLKPHLTALLPYVPIVSKGRGRDAYSDEEDGTGQRILRDNNRVLTPWNLALAVSVALGGARGVGLAPAPNPGYWPEAIAALVSLAAAWLLAYCNSQPTRLMVAIGGAAALLGIDSVLGLWPFDLLGAAPWLAITSLYVIFRGSSYKDLKEVWRNLIDPIKSVWHILLKSGFRLLRIIIGDSASRAAGLTNSPGN